MYIFNKQSLSFPGVSEVQQNARLLPPSPSQPIIVQLKNVVCQMKRQAGKGCQFLAGKARVVISTASKHKFIL